MRAYHTEGESASSFTAVVVVIVIFIAAVVVIIVIIIIITTIIIIAIQRTKNTVQNAQEKLLFYLRHRDSLVRFDIRDVIYIYRITIDLGLRSLAA